MKKIIALEILLTVIIVVLVILFGIGIYTLLYVSIEDNSVKILVFSAITLFVLLSGLIMARMALSSFITKGFFNNRSIYHLKYSGWLLIIFAVLCGAGDIIFTTLSKEHIIEFLFYLITFLLGLGLMVISDIVAKGEVLENENKLTI